MVQYGLRYIVRELPVANTHMYYSINSALYVLVLYVLLADMTLVFVPIFQCLISFPAGLYIYGSSQVSYLCS